jgi:hypothetical protein
MSQQAAHELSSIKTIERSQFDIDPLVTEIM